MISDLNRSLGSRDSFSTLQMKGHVLHRARAHLTEYRVVHSFGKHF